MIIFKKTTFNIQFALQMAAGLNARAISHLEEVSEQGMKDMAAAGRKNLLLNSFFKHLRETPVDSDCQLVHT